LSVDWKADQATILEISSRERKDKKTKEIKRYLVIKFQQPKQNAHTCLCFDKRLEKKLGEGLCCDLEGEVSFSPGSTYLVIRSVGEDDRLISAHE